MKVRPADPDAVIRDPHTNRRLPPEGDVVPDNVFWRRRVLDGDVVLLAEESQDRRTTPVGDEPIKPLTTR